MKNLVNINFLPNKLNDFVKCKMKTANLPAYVPNVFWILYHTVVLVNDNPVYAILMTLLRQSFSAE